MIFSAELTRKVLTRSKTMTRRPVRTVDGRVAPCAYKVGRDYAVQKQRKDNPARGGRELARIEVLEVRREPLGEITHADARAEGFVRRALFADYWMSLHDAKWPPAAECPACDGEGMISSVRRHEARNAASIATPCATCGGSGLVPVDYEEDDILKRFEARHGHKIVWVIRFRLMDPPRLLEARPSSAADTDGESGSDDHDRGYTTNPQRALIDEPEAVDEATLRAIVEDAHRRAEGEPGYRERQTRQLAATSHDRVKRLLAAGADPSAVLGVIATTEEHLRLLERQRS